MFDGNFSIQFMLVENYKAKEFQGRYNIQT